MTATKPSPRGARLCGLVGAALIAGMLVPATSSASVSCQYLNGARNLLVMTTSESMIVREGAAIVVYDVQAGDPVACGEKLGLRWTKKGAKSTRAALDQRSRLPALVRITATDAAGNRDTASTKVKVVD